MATDEIISGIEIIFIKAVADSSKCCVRRLFVKRLRPQLVGFETALWANLIFIALTFGICTRSNRNLHISSQ